MKRSTMFAAALLAATAASATDAWDGTWVGGWDAGHGVQLIVGGDEALGLDWDGEYVSELTSSIGADGKTMTIHWPAADATATLTDDGIAFVVHPAGKPIVTLTLTPDR
jgi:hypothetical protein